MEVLIRNVQNKEEERIVLECVQMTKDLDEIMEYIMGKEHSLVGYMDASAYRVQLEEVLYFEAVGDEVFAYTKDEVYLIKRRLYELEELYLNQRFIRCSKSMLVNLRKIESLRPEVNARYLARMKNGEDVVVSRMYAKQIKREMLAG